MIYIIDDFLTPQILENLNKYLVDFKEVDTGAKKFWVMDSIPDFEKWVENKISALEGVKVESILSFFRISTDKLETEPLYYTYRIEVLIC